MKKPMIFSQFFKNNGAVMGSALIGLVAFWLIFLIILPQLSMLDFSFRPNLPPPEIGGPKDIYDHPAERFVADFIGDTNFIAADLQSVSGDAAQVQLPGGKTVTARAVEGGANTGSITLAVRPEHATLTAEGGILNGNLQNIVYFGTDTHYHIALDSGTTFVVRRQNQPDTGEVFSEGQTVGIHFNDGVGQVLRD